MSRWITVEPLPSHDLPLAHLPQFPPEPACYVIYCDGKLSYVGQTTNLKKRLASYNFRYALSNNIITPWGFFRELVIKYRISRRYGDWAMTELRLIKRLQPIYNCIGSIRKGGQK